MFLNVRDMTHPCYQEHNESVQAILKDLGVELSLMDRYIEVLNKSDAIEDVARQVQVRRYAASHPSSVIIRLLKGIDISSPY